MARRNRATINPSAILNIDITITIHAIIRRTRGIGTHEVIIRGRIILDGRRGIQ